MRQVVGDYFCECEFETSSTRLVVNDQRYFAMFEISHHIARKDQWVVAYWDYSMDRTLEFLFEKKT